MSQSASDNTQLPTPASGGSGEVPASKPGKQSGLPIPAKPDTDSVLKLFGQHWTHARHCDTVQNAMAVALGATFAAALAYGHLDQKRLSVLLFGLSIAGLLISIKTWYLFQLHTALAEDKLALVGPWAIFMPRGHGVFGWKVLSVSLVVQCAYAVGCAGAVSLFAKAANLPGAALDSVVAFCILLGGILWVRSKAYDSVHCAVRAQARVRST